MGEKSNMRGKIQEKKVGKCKEYDGSRGHGGWGRGVCGFGGS